MHGVTVPLSAEEAATFPSLWNSYDAQFQKAVDGALRKEFKGQRAEAIKQKKVGIVVVDITDLKHPKVAAYNPDKMMYAASLPKIAILLGAAVMIDRGELVLNESLRASMTRMIRNSSNRDATAILKMVGFENLAEILQSERYRLYDPAHNGGLWVGRPYAKGPVWRRDPLHGISHGATAMQVARFYYLGVTGRLVSEVMLAEMRNIMSAPAIKHKFVKGLKQSNSDARIFRKSGTWRQFHSDSGVIIDDEAGYRYIIVSLANHPDGADGLRRLAIAVDKAVKGMHPDKKALEPIIDPETYPLPE
ncbi:MAG: serine hydrolase [Mariprofundus sp.]